MPERIAANGYRLYGRAQMERLQQILFYRELGLELSAIQKLLDSPDFSVEAALNSHLAELRARRKRMDVLIRNAESTLMEMKGEIKLNDKERFEGFKQKLIQDNEEKYGAEIREKYGDETVDAANAKMMNMTMEQYKAFEAVSARLGEALKAAVQSGDASGEAAQNAARLHREWLGFTWAQYTPEAHKGLVEMYLADGRFTSYYENIAPGAAQMLHDAVRIMLQ